MLQKVRRHVRSNAVGYVALVFALGVGTAWAGQQLARNSVDSRAIENREVKAKDLAKDAVDTEHVKNGSLNRDDFPEDEWHQTFDEPGVQRPGAGQEDTGTFAQTQFGDIALLVQCDARNWDGRNGSVTANAFVRFQGTGWLFDGTGAARRVTNETVQFATATTMVGDAEPSSEDYEITAVSEEGNMIHAAGVIVPRLHPSQSIDVDCVVPAAGFE